MFKAFTMSKPPQNIIAVTGTTATGKTSKALEIAQQQLKENKVDQVIIISADSKQIYSELPILTGADVPIGWEMLSSEKSSSKAFYHFFKHPALNIELHGIGILKGNRSWGAGEFAKLAGSLLKNGKLNTLFIIVGGNGFYHKQLFYPSESMSFKSKPNPELRAELEGESLENLQNKLREIWPERLESMNYSDENNPRRLIRAIEIATTDPQQIQLKIETKKTAYPHEKISMVITPKELEIKISQRIHDRIQSNVVGEVEKFDKKYPEKNLPAKTSLGYQKILEFIKGDLDSTELKKQWLIKELQYAKRQITWWQKYL